IGPDPRNFNQRVSLGRNDLLIRTFPSHMSKRVQPMKSGKYSKNCFVNHASWEYEMISETEALLEPYREMLELYHSAYIELGRKIRQYSKTKVAQ
ncbi:conjugative transfer protein MobI(A/C), partial [Salmonella enterica]|uniref:conjugative transfer protein MobI(A/C) n=1 Tax=Salmonella enterica TaxID=28901 RepID=UPI0023D84869